MSKKKMIILAIVLVIIVSVAAFSLWFFKKGSVSEIPKVVPIEKVSEDELYKPKPIELELMKDQEKEALNISSTTYRRIQVLERNPDGSIGAYRIINSDADILKEY